MIQLLLQMANESTQSTHAKWDVQQHVLFVRLYEDEVRNGNRPNTILSRKGWENVTTVFNQSSL